MHGKSGRNEQMQPEKQHEYGSSNGDELFSPV